MSDRVGSDGEDSARPRAWTEDSGFRGSAVAGMRSRRSLRQEGTRPWRALPAMRRILK